MRVSVGVLVGANNDKSSGVVTGVDRTRYRKVPRAVRTTITSPLRMRESGLNTPSR